MCAAATSWQCWLTPQPSLFLVPLFLFRCARVTIAATRPEHHQQCGLTPATVEIHSCMTWPYSCGRKMLVMRAVCAQMEEKDGKLLAGVTNLWGGVTVGGQPSSVCITHLKYVCILKAQWKAREMAQ